MTKPEPPPPFPGWSWLLAFLTPLWFLWRRQYLWFGLILAALFANSWIGLRSMNWDPWPQALWFTLAALPFEVNAGLVPSLNEGTGNIVTMLMFAQLILAYRLARRSTPPPPAQRRVLLVGVALGVGLGVLGFTSMRVPGTKPRAYQWAMKNDLHNLVTEEMAWYADHVTYSASLDSLRFQPSTGVTVQIGAVSGTGFNATATHNAMPRRHCGVFVGSAPPPLPGGDEGQPYCRWISDSPDPGR